MPDEPDNLVLLHLREIRGDLTKIRDKLAEHDTKFEQLGKRLDEVHETAVYGVGLAAMANYKLDQMKERVEDHEQRISAIETDSVAQGQGLAFAGLSGKVGRVLRDVLEPACHRPRQMW